MPNSINGIGTTYYGQCAFEPDGSFITTKWFVLGFFPCAPLGSLRVRQLESSGIPFLARSTGYELIESLPMHWAQVLRTWGYTLFLIVVFAKIIESNMAPMGKFVTLALVVLLPTVIRAFLKRRG